MATDLVQSTDYAKYILRAVRNMRAAMEDWENDVLPKTGRDSLKSEEGKNWRKLNDIFQEVKRGRYPTTIGIFGAMKRGKSSLINELLGCDLLPVKARQMSSSSVWIRSDPRMRKDSYYVRISRKKGKDVIKQGLTLIMAKEMLEKYASHAGQNKEGVDKVEVVSKFPSCKVLKKGGILIDTPGAERAFSSPTDLDEDANQTQLESINEEDSQKALKVLDEARIVLFVERADNMESKQSVSFFKEHVRETDPIVVVNMKDKCSDEAKCREKLHKTYGADTDNVVFTSSKEASDIRKCRGAEKDLFETGLPKLEEKILHELERSSTLEGLVDPLLRVEALLKDWDRTVARRCYLTAYCSLLVLLRKMKELRQSRSHGAAVKDLGYCDDIIECIERMNSRFNLLDMNFSDSMVGEDDLKEKVKAAIADAPNFLRNYESRGFKIAVDLAVVAGGTLGEMALKGSKLIGRTIINKLGGEGREERWMLFGLPGCGKTTYSTILIHSLQRLCAESESTPWNFIGLRKTAIERQSKGKLLSFFERKQERPSVLSEIPYRDFSDVRLNIRQMEEDQAWPEKTMNFDGVFGFEMSPRKCTEVVHRLWLYDFPGEDFKNAFSHTDSDAETSGFKAIYAGLHYATGIFLLIDAEAMLNRQDDDLREDTLTQLIAELNDKNSDAKIAILFVKTEMFDDEVSLWELKAYFRQHYPDAYLHCRDNFNVRFFGVNALGEVEIDAEGRMLPPKHWKSDGTNNEIFEPIRWMSEPFDKMIETIK